MSYEDIQKQPPPPPVVDEEVIKARSAAARAYALASSGEFTSPVKYEAEPAQANPYIPHVQDEEYALFVKTLTDDDFFRSLPDEDDADDFNLEGLDDEDDDDDTDDDVSPEKLAKLLPDDDDEPFTIETELGLLMEEELENAVASLLNSSNPPPTTPEKITEPEARTPLRESRRKATTVTESQMGRLKTLMRQHYQLLVQQCVLCIRSATKKHSHGGESADDLAEILDGAVGMLQDLDENRKDAYRNSIQLEQAKKDLLEGRLTRAAFTKKLQLLEANPSPTSTTFDVPGLSHLKNTFVFMDDAKALSDITDPKEACRQVLMGSSFDEKLLPGAFEFSELLSQPKEVFGEDFSPPCMQEQIYTLKRDRNQFTAGEDSLVFRGVNLYGEKQWLLIADRFLPDRSINIISQRYSKLSLLLFKAHGIKIDEEGNLEAPPKIDSIDKADFEKVEALKRVDPPAILNVHRWSIEEDLALLRAVPVLGHMWAELSSRVLPHRDRGHLRKRYQVLERRIKATVSRSQKDVSRHQKKESSTPPQFLKKRSSVATSKTRPPLRKPGHPLPASNTETSHRGNEDYPSHQNPSYPYPYQYHQHNHGYHHYGQPLPPTQQSVVPRQFEDPEGEESRFGVERLLNEQSAPDDSQMVRVQEMIKAESPTSKLESEIANTLASQLAYGGNHHTERSAPDALQRLRNHVDINPDEDSKDSSRLSSPALSRKRGATKASTPLSKLVQSPSNFSALSPPKPFSPFGLSNILNPVDSQDGFGYEISDRSRQMMAGDTIAELEAAATTALNELSNSPARFATTTHDKKESQQLSGSKRSLFDKVVKGADSRNKKRK